VSELAGTQGSSALDQASGTLNFKDLDLTDTHSVAVAPEGAGYLGTFTPVITTDSTGNKTGVVSWTYQVVDGALDFLAAGQKLVQVYDVTVSDGNGGSATRTVTITLVGSDDAPSIIAGASTNVSVLPAFGTPASTVFVRSASFQFTDIDLADKHTVSVKANGTGYLATLTPVVSTDSTDGSVGTATWTYQVKDSALAALSPGQVVTQSYTITINDGHGGKATQDVTVTLTGNDHAPLISLGAQDSAAGSVSDDGSKTALATAGTLSFSDVDVSDMHSVAVAPQPGNLGTLAASLTNDSTGSGTGGQVSWSYSASESGVQFLGVVETGTDTFAVTVDDGRGGSATQNVTVTIHGTNDAAVIGTPTVADVTEDVNADPAGNLVATGTISISDADQNQSSFQTSVVAANGNLGTLVLAGDGSYTYTVANSAVQYHGQNDSKVDSFSIAALDGTSKAVSFTIHGTNDAPTIDTNATTPAGQITELANTTGSNALDQTSGTIAYNDVDVTDVHRVSQSGPSFSWSGGQLSTAQLSTLMTASALTLNAHDSTGSGTGTGRLDLLGHRQRARLSLCGRNAHRHLRCDHR
jgi:VCBS repeat-containing protein